MAHFIADISGSRGPASRLGSKSSGIQSHTRGWAAGVEVVGRNDAELGDVFDIYATTGSSPRGRRAFVGYVDARGQFIAAKVGA